MTAKVWTASSLAIGILATVVGLAFAETGHAKADRGRQIGRRCAGASERAARARSRSQR
jgi:hypothetical protein